MRVGDDAPSAAHSLLGSSAEVAQVVVQIFERTDDVVAIRGLLNDSASVPAYRVAGQLKRYFALAQRCTVLCPVYRHGSLKQLIF
jgi:hypothetical protein